jgi:intermediate cleaving peptidase 55
MVLIDAGGEYHMYASDITRTFPVAGRFSPAQRDLYEAVLNVQKALVAKCKPGDANLNELHRESESCQAGCSSPRRCHPGLR